MVRRSTKKNKPGRRFVKGIGRRYALYVPVDEEPLMEQVRGRLDARRAEGSRSSLSFEIIRLVKLGLASD